MGAGTVVQGLSALAGFAVLPILVQDLGSATFGALVVIVSLGPWLMVLDGALYPATRILVGEGREGSQARASNSLLRDARSMAFRVMAFNIVVVAGCLVALPLTELFGLESSVGPVEFSASVALFSLPIIASGPGGLYLGALEGVGRTVVAAAISGIGPIIALPLTMMVASSGGGLIWLSAIQGLALSLPRFAAWAYWYWRPSATGDGRDRTGVALRVALLLQLAVLAALALAQTGLAPVIVSSQLGAEAAASYGMAWRIVAGSLLPLGIMTPLFAGSIAAARGGGWTRRSEADLRRLIWWSLGVGLLCGACVALLGPLITRLLSGGAVAAPTLLVRRRSRLRGLPVREPAPIPCILRSWGHPYGSAPQRCAHPRCSRLIGVAGPRSRACRCPVGRCSGDGLRNAVLVVGVAHPAPPSQRGSPQRGDAMRTRTDLWTDVGLGTLAGFIAAGRGRLGARSQVGRPISPMG